MVVCVDPLSVHAWVGGTMVAYWRYCKIITVRLFVCFCYKGYQWSFNISRSTQIHQQSDTFQWRRHGAHIVNMEIIGRCISQSQLTGYL